MRDKSLSERGYSYAGKMLQAILASLTTVWAREGRSANPEEWSSEEYQKRPHHHWGHLYTASEVKFNWHTPTEAEVDFALEALHTVAGPAVERLEQLMEPGNPVNKEWRNDFNRYTNLIRAGLAGVAALTVVTEPETAGESVTDIGCVSASSVSIECL